jgi:transcriptional regulator with XRE-family HTH domain
VEDLRTLRRRRFLTQKQLAEKVGVSYQTIQAWEGGKSQPRLRHIPPLAEALGVDPVALLPEVDAEGKAAA